MNDSIFVPDVDEMQVVMNIVLPSQIDSCDGYVVIDSVLNYGGAYDNLSFFWNPGEPDGLGQDSLWGVCFSEYSLTINNELRCGVVVEFSVGNLELTSVPDPEILVYPNPFHEYIKIETSEKLNAVIISDLEGKIIFESYTDNENSEIQLNHFENGIYSIELNFLNGQKIYRRLVKY